MAARCSSSWATGCLAIFPLTGNGDDAPEVCTRALACAREAEALIEKLDAPVCVATKNMVRFGLALHVGQVMYGNIGGGNRLDFTCIGPAVNLAARLEKVAAQMGQTIVASAEFASHVPGQFQPTRRMHRGGFLRAAGGVLLDRAATMIELPRS